MAVPVAGSDDAGGPGKPRRPGQFAPGRSGNPKGRPMGARNRVVAKLDKLAEESAEDIMREALRLARAGDSAVLRLILERLWPARKGRSFKMLLPDMDATTGAGEALSRVVQMMADGELSPEEAEAVAAVVAHRVRAVEIETLERQVAALEQQLADREQGQAR